MDIGAIWDLIILSPMINTLIVVTGWIGGGAHSFGVAIILLTIVVRFVTLPLTIRQISTTKKIQQLQPRIAELQKKFGRDKQRMAKEQMALYKELGISPTGCMVPMLAQLPVWISLFQSIIRILAVVPEDFLKLSGHLYSSWTGVFALVPLSSTFLWLDLAAPDGTFILPILVGASMWVQQKMSTVENPDPRQRQTSQMMLWMMPIMFTFLSLQFPSGLALYWVITNVISVIIQHRVAGWGGLSRRGGPASSKPVSFEGKPGPKLILDGSADVSADADKEKTGIEKPSRFRYQPGKDRSGSRKKK